MKLLNYIAILLLFTSCVEVGFKHPQPEKGKALNSIPTEMVSFYTNQEKDTTSGNTKGFNLSDLNSDISKEGVLSETTILKQWKGRYFLNQKEDSLWYIIMIIELPDKTYETYKLDGGNESTVLLLKEITNVEKVYSESGELKLIIIDPSASEFKKIIKSSAFEKIDIF